MAWVAWLIAAVALGVAEFFTLTLAFGLLAAAALVAAIVAGVGASVLAQVLAFAITAGVGLLIVRPIARRQMTHPPVVREGSYALVGKKAVVLEEVTGTQGLIKLAGEVWSARALDEDQVIPAGTPVDVMEIDGATAIVYPRELLP
jgi:membrane protein implicated in regulation of membrane protease activity